MEKWNKSVTQLQKVYIYLCVGVSKPLLRCWKFDRRPNRTIRIDFIWFFSVSSPAPEMRKCVCLWREHWVYFQCTRCAQHPTIPRVDQSTRVKFNRSPSLFSHSLSLKTSSFRFLYSDAREEEISAEISQMGKRRRRKKHFGEEESVAMGFLLLGDTHTHKREGGSVKQ